MFEYDSLAMVDGGSRGVGPANEGYGSYRLSTRDGKKQTIRLDFGRGVTTNEAEYRTLIAGLKDLVGRIQRAGMIPSDYSLLPCTDSQLLTVYIGAHIPLRLYSEVVEVASRSTPNGALKATVVPAPGRLSTKSPPPMAAARSCILSIPRLPRWPYSAFSVSTSKP
jgi:hypothetical protein